MSTTTYTEWVVETDECIDMFDEDEREARAWLARSKADPDWRRTNPVLKSRTVTTTYTDWTEVTA